MTDTPRPDLAKFDLSAEGIKRRESTERSALQPDARRVRSDGRLPVSPAEIVSWALVVVGFLVFAVAAFSFADAQKYISGNTAAPMMWMVLGGAVATLTLAPALILSGIRSMFSRR